MERPRGGATRFTMVQTQMHLQRLFDGDADARKDASALPRTVADLRIMGTEDEHSLIRMLAEREPERYGAILAAQEEERQFCRDTADALEKIAAAARDNMGSLIGSAEIEHVQDALHRFFRITEALKDPPMFRNQLLAAA